MFRMPVLVSPNCFEDFYEPQFGLSLDTYVKTYANDWMFEYAAALEPAQIGFDLIIPSRRVCEVVERCSVRRPSIRIFFVPIAPAVASAAGRLPRTWVGQFLRSILYTAGPVTRVLDRYPLVYVQEYSTGRFWFVAWRLGKTHAVIGGHHGASIYPRAARMLRPIRKRIAALTAQTETECRNVERLIPGVCIRRIPNIVDPHVFRPSSSPRDGLIWVGRLDDRTKYLSHLLQAVSMLPASNCPRLLVVGDGPDRTSLEQLAMSLGLDGRVLFAGGMTDRAALAGLFASAALFVNCSPSEAMAMTTLEAAACATPMVLTDIVGHSHVKGQPSVLYYRFGDVAELATVLRRALDHLPELHAAALRVRDEAIEGATPVALAEHFRELLAELGTGGIADRSEREA